MRILKIGTAVFAFCFFAPVKVMQSLVYMFTEVTQRVCKLSV